MKSIAAKIIKNRVHTLVIFTSVFLFVIAMESAECKGLVLYFSFDEGSGNVVKDLSNNGNDGVINNCEWADGKFGSALEIEGTADSFVEVADSDTLSSWEALTISAWVKMSSFAQNWGRIIDKDGDPPGGTGFWMATRDNGAVSVGFWNQPNVLVCIDISEAKMVMDEWNHLVFVWEELGDFTVYLNGKEDQKMSKNTPCNTRKGVPLLIGKPSEADEAAVDIEFYAGLVDEVAIYNYAFSKDEIENAMNGQLSGVAVEAFSKLAVAWGAIKRE